MRERRRRRKERKKGVGGLTAANHEGGWKESVARVSETEKKEWQTWMQF